jgi:carboxynorspermidine decarboxylase
MGAVINGKWGASFLKNIKTPAFIIDQNILQSDLVALKKVSDQAECKLLYSLKASSSLEVLRSLIPHVEGFGCSSLFELKLIDSVCNEKRSLHLVSPLITQEVLEELGERLQYLTVNSLSQWDTLRRNIHPSTQVGLRVNPQISFVGDPRYDPCRQHSKLGVPIDTLAELVRSNQECLRGITGLHFHTNCDEENFSSLLATVRHVQDILPHVLERISWVNMGGGYLFNTAESLDDFYSAVSIFRNGYGLDVFIEPGAALVRRSGTIVAEVHDIFESDGRQIAVLDTTVNHMPEVFEFQFEPDVLGYVEGGLHAYILAGCTCLAGDVFGDYTFDTPLTVGSKITFLNMGAYTMAKAHRFNGVALPTVYTRQPNGSLKLIREDTYHDFVSYMGTDDHAVA